MTKDEINAALDEAATWVGGRGTGANSTPEQQDEITVEDGYQCPQCSENREDALTWSNANRELLCSSCGTRYKPSPRDTIDVLEDIVNAQSARIDGLETQLQEQDEAMRSLGVNLRREMEQRYRDAQDGSRERDAKQRELSADIITNLEGKSARLNRLEALIENRKEG